MSLSGKVALVTGGAQGIGRAVVESLMRCSAKVSIYTAGCTHTHAGLVDTRLHDGGGTCQRGYHPTGMLPTTTGFPFYFCVYLYIQGIQLKQMV